MIVNDFTVNIAFDADQAPRKATIATSTSVLPDERGMSVDVIGRGPTPLSKGHLMLCVSIEGAEIEFPLDRGSVSQKNGELVAENIRQIVERQGEISFIETALNRVTFEPETKIRTLEARYHPSYDAFVQFLATGSNAPRYATA